MQHSLRDRILAKVELHASLLGRLAGNENVPILLKESQSQLDQLTKQLNDERDKLLECEKKTKQEYDQVAALKRNTTKRLLVLMANGGRKRGLDSVVEKGETGYLQAFQEEQEQKDKVMALEGATNAATTETEELKQRLGKYIDVRRQLDTIYRDLFNGSTPEFPEEDEAEQAVRTAETLYQTAKAAYKCEHEALSLLKKAEHTISICHKYMRKVERYSLHNAYNNIGIFNDIMEPDVLEKAQGSAKQVEELMKKATELMPAIKSIGKLEVVWGYNPKEPEFLGTSQDLLLRSQADGPMFFSVHRKNTRVRDVRPVECREACERGPS
ncbi:hypothetical protein BOTBODRAFT_572251 [Botryobasidium botryosum FD-172 SS1]|uniref:Uncharacterized protein n=1 Tax=Botryobasidium botryosum (strain FD-172 SS1) TaxID=930990 RepID=A0A067M0F3_BOTB1|nr:hypothetical protein BOTBODRAFT_572251 [Botryobasidium botryosum FD-172 SS1]